MKGSEIIEILGKTIENVQANQRATIAMQQHGERIAARMAANTSSSIEHQS
ncbi:hypothetical protein [Burkholderia ubonensis]|uniref:hypothetical protein n=1 Tax=Burkholderia ubonensis TaxID=101571 RepID=UPI000A457F64|nr:hypothetical protein [Burkholderia ubonensis]